MIYKYQNHDSYDFLSAGSVIYSPPGSPNFPVRLGNEIFNRAITYGSKKTKLNIYDPCCGTSYLLTSTALLNPDKIDKIFASDINLRFLDFARKNLALLTKAGLMKRREKLENMFRLHAKESHKEALLHLRKIELAVNQINESFYSHVFERDILNSASNEFEDKMDLVITDVPYGELVEWNQDSSLSKFLDKLISNLEEDAVVAIVYDKSQKLKNTSFQRLEKFKVGKRIVEILKTNFS